MVDRSLMIPLFQIFKLIIHKSLQMHLSLFCWTSIFQFWSRNQFEWILYILDSKLILSEWLVHQYIVGNFLNLSIRLEAIFEIDWLNGFTIFVYFLQILLKGWLIRILMLSTLSFSWLLSLSCHLSDINIWVESWLDDTHTYHVWIMLTVSLESLFPFEIILFEIILFEIGLVVCRPSCCEYRISLLSDI
jgi:hypothetical protein